MTGVDVAETGTEGDATTTGVAAAGDGTIAGMTEDRETGTIETVETGTEMIEGHGIEKIGIGVSAPRNCESGQKILMPSRQGERRALPRHAT